LCTDRLSACRFPGRPNNADKAGASFD